MAAGMKGRRLEGTAERVSTAVEVKNVGERTNKHSNRRKRENR